MRIIKNRAISRSLCCNRAVFLLCSVVGVLVLLTSLIPQEHRAILAKFRPLHKPVVTHNPLLFPLVREFKLSSRLKKFYNEGARVVGFRTGAPKHTSKSPPKIIYLATKYFDQLNLKHYYFFQLGNRTFARYSCPVNNCYVTKKPTNIVKADAVVFHVRDLEVFSFPSHRAQNQVWILYSMEPPWLEMRDFRRLNNLFNWTMSYRRNSTILMKYGFIGQRQKSDTADTHFLTDLLKRKLNRAVWFVSNCNTDSNREEYVGHLRKIYPVDVIGGCGTKGCELSESRQCYDEVAKRYKFYLAFENAICQDYVTEKLFNSLEFPMIPVTLGGVNYSNMTPSYSIINAMEFASPEDLGHYLWKVSRNDTLYMSYFKWKSKYRSYFQPWMCDLCEKLHEKMPSNVIYDVYNWWHEEGSCLRWTTSGFKQVEKYAFPKYKLRLFE